MAHSVTLNWQAPSGSSVASYNVKRAPANVTPSVFVSIGTSATTTFLDNNVVEGQGYLYEVDAVNATGEGAPSNVASASVPFQIPGAPTNLVATVA